MSAPTISKGRTWTAGETVTPARINELVDAATLNFTATKKLAARTSSGAGPAEEATFGTTGQALAAAETAADGRTALSLGTMATQAHSNVSIGGGAATLHKINANIGTIIYGSPTVLDFGGAYTYETVTLAGDLTISAVNVGSGVLKLLRIVADGTDRALIFPAWTPLGAALPSTLGANKSMLLVLISYGTLPASVIAIAHVEP